MAKILIVDAGKCVGCRDCELVCSAKHYQTFKSSLSGIAVIKFDEISRDVPMVCQQCEDAPCQAVCPVNAISRNEETGAYVINFDLCIGCKTCASACPFGAIHFDDEERRPIKCDLCDGDPECVKICPSEAIKYEEADRASLAKRRESIEHLPELLKLISGEKE